MSAPDSAGLETQLAAAHAEIADLRSALDAARQSEAGLRAELQHRVRNMLAITRSIFTRTAATGRTVEEVADHFAGRLDTVIRYQSFHLLDQRDTVDFELMVRDELQSFQFGDDPGITIEGDEARMGRDVAQLAALAVHELVTNSLKYGALSGTAARAHLHIGWTVASDILTFSWTESGVPVVATAPLRRGFGREFIEQALPYQVGGITSFDLRPGGLICIMTFPLDAAVAPMI